MMSAWETQLLQSVDGMSEVYRQPLLEIIRIFRSTTELESNTAAQKESHKGGKRKLGIAKGKTLIADGYDFDECNDEIAEMFGVNV